MFQAVSYYETALKTDALDCCLSVELSELLLKLKRLEEAQQVLEKALEHEPSIEITTQKNMIECFEKNRIYSSQPVTFLLLQLLH